MKNKFLIWLLLLLFPFAGMAQELPERPNPPKLVNDFTGTLSAGEVSALESKLVAYDDSTSTQIAVVILSSLDGYPVDDYSFQLAEAWGIGQKGKNNGVLLLIAKDDRKLFIATGYGMEGVMPDGLVKRIVEQDIKPFFKMGRYYDGINSGVDSMIRLAAGEYTADAKGAKGTPIFFILGVLFFIILFIVIKIKSVKSYASVNSISFWTAWTLLNQARNIHHGRWGGFTGGGGSSWGGGGGGFGGFGGGSFGGGGAGGSW